MIYIIRAATLAVCFIAIVVNSFAEEADSTKPTRKIKFLPVPSFGYAPETGTYAGAVSLFTIDWYKDSSTRVSNAKLEFTYTWRKQLIVQSTWNYFFKKEKWYTQGNLMYSLFPDLYYGVGEETPDNFKTSYQSNRININFNLLRKTGNRLFIGPAFRYINYYSVSYIEGKTGFSELADAQITGAGVTVLKDSRNSLLTPQRGIYAELTNTYNSWGKTLYSKVTIDMRTYYSRKNATASVRLLNDLSFGDPPFYDLALMGNDNRVRGYYYGRFREKNLTTLQAEWRTLLFWRLGAAVFGGITKMYANLQTLSFNNIKPNYGAGIRFLIDRKQNINLRLDYAVGSNGQDGFYVAFGESF